MARLSLSDTRWYAAESELGSRQSRRIGHNTTLERRGDDRIGIRYHATDILTVTRDGWLIVDCNGWTSSTTMQRLGALLPSPWHVRAGTLYRAGAPVMPYADGIALHVGTVRSGADATDSVGFSTDRATVAPMMTAADVDAIVGAWQLARDARAEKRAARLLREHPEAGTPHGHKGFDAGDALYGRRPRDCDRCHDEATAAREAQRQALRAEHAALVATLARNPDTAAPWTDAEYAAAGGHVRRDTVREYPLLAGSTYSRDYSATPAESERVTVACPWPCPEPRIGGRY